MFKLKATAAFLILFSARPVFAQDLIETYHLAMENDPEIKSAYLNQFSVAEIKSQSIAQMLPNISLSATSSRNRLYNKKRFTFQSGGEQYYYNHGFNINFTQPVFNWGHWVQLDQSDNRIAQSEAEYQAQFQSLMVRASEAYFKVLAAQDNLEFSTAEKKAIEKQLEQAKQRFDVGLIAITDVYEAQAAFDQSDANEIEAANLVDNAKESLRELIGENEAELNPLQEQIDLKKPDPMDIASWTESAKNNNFSIVAQLNQAEVARKEVSLKQSDHLPTLDIVANYSAQDQNSTFGLRGDTQSVGVQLNLPIFEGGGTYSRAQQAEYDYQRAKEDLTKVQRAVTRQVRNAYRGVITSISQVKSLTATVKSAESALEATEAGFEVGTRTMVDVLIAQRNLYRSKRDYAKSRYDYLINSIKLKEAAGNLSEADLQSINNFLTL